MSGSSNEFAGHVDRQDMNEIRVLPYFAVFDERGRRKHIASGQVGALITMLVLKPGHRVTHEEVARLLWPGQEVGATRIRVLCNLIRQKLPNLLVSPNPPLAVELDVERVDRAKVDYLRFRDYWSQAMQASDESRVGLLKLALDEWPEGLPPGGPELPYSDKVERQRLDDEHRVVLTSYARALRDVGNGEGFSVQLQRGLRRWPDDEILLGLESGGGREGIRENGPHGTATGQDLLRDSASGRRRLQQLPLGGRDIVGRTDEVAELDRLLSPSEGSSSGIVVVVGMPGIGKTELVRCWARRKGHAFTETVLYADLNGFGPGEPADTTEVLARMLKDVEVDPIPETLEGMITAFRSATADQGRLVVLDNARDANHARPLLPGRGSLAVITSRDRLDGLRYRDGANTIALAPLDVTAGVELLGTDLDAGVLRDFRPHLAEITKLVGGLPLALMIVAARLSKHAKDAIREILALLREQQTRLDALDHTDPTLNLRVALSYSTERLSPRANRVFRVLALSPAPTTSRGALTYMMGFAPLAELNELVEAHLLDDPEHHRYKFHDLVRDYALELSGSDPAEERDGHVERFLEFLLHNAWACDRILVPDRRLPIDTPASCEVVAPASQAEAMSRLDAEELSITAAIRYAAGHGFDRYAWLLTMVMVTYWWRRRLFSHAGEMLRQFALPALERAGSRSDLAMAHRMVAGTYWNLDKRAQALTYQVAAVGLSRESGDRRGEAYGQTGLANLHLAVNRADAAEESYLAALDLFRDLEDQLGEADVLNGLAEVNHDLKRYTEALAYGTRAAELFEREGDVNDYASAQVMLGRIHLALGQNGHAVAHLDVAIARYREIERPDRENRALFYLVDCLLADRRTTEARAALRRAGDLCRELEDEEGEAEVARRLAGIT
ncbi:tetratricopeptide repeat protein [Actinosynnema sp. NPDC020468]|uniref:ATP-binding protein n=1 Tax=Actinosynnema sp. NPDC020468 TaxID=3154488 RepID=UPI0033E6D16D